MKKRFTAFLRFIIAKYIAENIEFVYSKWYKTKED